MRISFAFILFFSPWQRNANFSFPLFSPPFLQLFDNFSTISPCKLTAAFALPPRPLLHSQGASFTRFFLKVCNTFLRFTLFSSTRGRRGGCAMWRGSIKATACWCAEGGEGKRVENTAWQSRLPLAFESMVVVGIFFFFCYCCNLYFILFASVCFCCSCCCCWFYLSLLLLFRFFFCFVFLPCFCCCCSPHVTLFAFASWRMFVFNIISR